MDDTTPAGLDKQSQSKDAATLKEGNKVYVPKNEVRIAVLYRFIVELVVFLNKQEGKVSGSDWGYNPLSQALVNEKVSEAILSFPFSALVFTLHITYHQILSPSGEASKKGIHYHDLRLCPIPGDVN